MAVSFKISSPEIISLIGSLRSENRTSYEPLHVSHDLQCSNVCHRSPSFLYMWLIKVFDDVLRKPHRKMLSLSLFIPFLRKAVKIDILKNWIIVTIISWKLSNWPSWNFLWGLRRTNASMIKNFTRIHASLPFL